MSEGKASLITLIWTSTFVSEAWYIIQAIENTFFTLGSIARESSYTRMEKRKCDSREKEAIKNNVIHLKKGVKE